jgi:ParB-like chromosome segregation protein Spo0J
LQWFPFLPPSQRLVVDENDVIIVGHTRYKAALKLGMETVPVHVARGLSPAQARAYRIADNQTATFSRWDEDRLPLELIELQKADFDLSRTWHGSKAGASYVGPESRPRPDRAELTRIREQIRLGFDPIEMPTDVFGDEEMPRNVFS